MMLDKLFYNIRRDFNSRYRPSEFPDGVLLNIFSSLSNQDLLQVGLVNRKWRANALKSAYGEFRRFNQVKLDYEEIVRKIAIYINMKDIQKLLMLQNEFTHPTCFPDILRLRMNRALDMMVKEIKLADLNKLIDVTPYSFKKIVKLEIFYKIIDLVDENDDENKRVQLNKLFLELDLVNENDRENKQLILNQLFLNFIKLNEWNGALNLLNKLDDKKALFFHWIHYLVNHQRYEDAIKIASMECNGLNKSYEPLQFVFGSLLEKNNIREAIKCAFLLQRELHELTAFSQICSYMGCEMKDKEPITLFFSYLGKGKRSVIPICAKLAEYDLEQALLIADDLEHHRLKDDVLLAIIETINKDRQKIQRVQGIAALISNSAKRKKAMNV